MSALPESPFEKQTNDPVLKDMLRIAQGASDILATFFKKADLHIAIKTKKQSCTQKFVNYYRIVYN